MKIISFSKIDGQIKMAMKGDSSLLVNRKPFFIPDWSNDIRMTPCVVIRISRLGKNIGAKFATRYYDAAALGLNIFAADFVAQGDWTRGWAFDYSLPLGTWLPLADNPWKDLVIDIDFAIELASQVMTLRQGDFIAIDCNIPSRQLIRDEVVKVQHNDQEILYCKIK